jgi:predicted SAM-dependent methyltransferase
MTPLDTLPADERKTVAHDPPASAPPWSGLNLGCGSRFHPAWINVDLQPVHASIRRLDVTQRLPFDDAAFDAVYHSHVLEHLTRDCALSFLQECKRVLKPGGILRMAIPNLEAIVRLYLYALEDAWRGDEEALAHHRWLVMELYDQATRERSGGSMLHHLQEEPCELAWFRLGIDGTRLQKQLPSLARPANPTWRDRWRGWLLGSWRERLVRLLLGKEYALLQLGRFRRGGEIHHWMYDRVSLRDLLRQAGFEHFRCTGPAESAIPNWTDYHLDMAPDGAVCKPDSLFVEAQRESEP